MIKAILKRTANNKFTTRPKVRMLGKKGREQRMFAKNWKTLLEKAVKPRSNVESAVNLANILQRQKPLIDVANYNVFKGKTKQNHVRAKQPRQMGCRELMF